MQARTAEVGSLAILIFLVAFVGAALLSGCASVQAAWSAHERSRGEMFAEAVRIDAQCLIEHPNGQLEGVGWYGSGVIVDSVHVVTAGHVAKAPAAGAVCAWLITDAQGQQYAAQVEILDVETDTAVLALQDGQLPSVGYVVGDPPELGDRVCAATGFPMRRLSCGYVMPYDKAPGDIVMDAIVEPGNSGSGLYDSRGRLIGIVTHMWTCGNGQLCGGKATSLFGRKQLRLGAP